MRILIANDDGYLAPGLAALVQACEGLGQLDVVAPEQNASGTSNSLTLNRPLSAFTAPNGFRYLNGTPSDCVHVALTGWLSERPDLIVTGINQGANMGDDTLYSGTVAAAMEGFLFGIPAIAFSQVHKGWAHLDAAARVARSVIVSAVRTPFGRLGGALKDYEAPALGAIAIEADVTDAAVSVAPNVDAAGKWWVYAPVAMIAAILIGACEPASGRSIGVVNNSAEAWLPG